METRLCEHDHDLLKLVERGFSMDTLGIKDPIQSLHGTKNAKKPEDQWTNAERKADEKMVVTFYPHEGTSNGHYDCTIPWENGKPDLQNNAASVKIRQNKTFSQAYLDKKGASMEEIRAYFDKFEKSGYIERIEPERQKEPDSFYLPWFPVIDRSRESTKMRIVFDASVKDRNGKSLNSQIASTPNRTNDLLNIILNFRKYRYVVTGDISEMFLRIKMVEADRKYHRFFIGNELWQWTSIVFGETSSPNASQKTLQTNAESQDLQRAKHTVDNYMYVDDMITCFREEGEACLTCEEMIESLAKGGFTITKFYTNSPQVLDMIPKELISKKVVFGDKDPEIDASKVLGITYNANDDSFTYKSKFKDVSDFCNMQNIPEPVKWSKRLILTCSATVYDPPGFLCPFTVRAKSILQDLWHIKLEWDDQIPETQHATWHTWIEELFRLESIIKIPRHLHLDNAIGVTLHVFVDASTKAFAAAAYLVIKTDDRDESIEDGSEVENTGVFSREVGDLTVSSSLALAKGRVTPIKTESVSRLELAACVIGVRLGHTAAKCYDISPEDIIYWTDSTNCLFWLNTPANTLKTFVAHRVGEIQNHSNIANWRHVPTDINPADIPTRMPSIEELAANKTWWNGPDFLLKDESEWPEKFIPKVCTNEGKDEFKKFAIMTAQVIEEEETLTIGQQNPVVLQPRPIPSVEQALDPKRFSVGKLYNGYERLLNVTTIFLQGIYYRIRRQRGIPEIQAHDKATLRDHAIKYHLRRAQEESPRLSELKNQLQQKEPPKDKIFKRKGTPCERRYGSLDPFMDKEGLIRSKSRLSNCEHLKYDAKYPVILDNESGFAKLLVKNAHQLYGHAVGEETIKAKLRENYAIIGLNQMVTAARTGCKTCGIKRRQPFEQRMAPIPEYRFEAPLRAFAKTGLDFAGPFETKFGRGRARKKVYILVLTCMQIRAVHLEVTDSQDMTAVMNAMTRFVDIRGMPTDILSDNFSTFISEDKELQDWVRHLDSDLLIKSEGANVKWHLTPPHAPHHGGIYETMVKATKRALKSINDRENLDLDEFRTLVSRCAAIINGRPLKRIPDDPSVTILTPNHFLYGNMGGAITTENLTPLQRWKTINKLQDEYWKILMLHFWPELKRLRKWKIVNPEVRIDQIVVENLPGLGTGQWRLAKVIELIPSSDGKIRKVKVKTSHGIFTRAITNLCPLELD